MYTLQGYFTGPFIEQANALPAKAGNDAFYSASAGGGSAADCLNASNIATQTVETAIDLANGMEFPDAEAYYNFILSAYTAAVDAAKKPEKTTLVVNPETGTLTNPTAAAPVTATPSATVTTATTTTQTTTALTSESFIENLKKYWYIAAATGLGLILLTRKPVR